MKKILAINPGSTSTKIAVFHNSRPIFLKNVKHDCDEIEDFDAITEQYEFRKKCISVERAVDLGEINPIGTW